MTITAPLDLPSGPQALVVAHPGHELRVYGWLRAARPQVHILTDGSGRSGRSRLDDTLRTLSEAEATRGSILARLTDAAAYAAILSARTDVFIALVDELDDEWTKAGVTCVVGDAVEGYNPVHDVCRLIVNAAVFRARRRGREIVNLDFAVVGRAVAVDGDHALSLDDDLFRAKLEAARRCGDLAPDVEEALKLGADAFRHETLRQVRGAGPHDGLPDEIPFYETHGSRRVAAGKYARIIRRREHILPLAEALWRHAGGGVA